VFQSVISDSVLSGDARGSGVSLSVLAIGVDHLQRYCFIDFHDYSPRRSAFFPALVDPFPVTRFSSAVTGFGRRIGLERPLEPVCKQVQLPCQRHYLRRILLWVGFPRDRLPVRRLPRWRPRGLSSCSDAPGNQWQFPHLMRVVRINSVDSHQFTDQVDFQLRDRVHHLEVPLEPPLVFRRSRRLIRKKRLAGKCLVDFVLQPFASQQLPFQQRGYFKLYKSQIPVVEQAIETAALMLGTDKSRGYCLEMICADFLAGANLENGNSHVLLQSILRFFKFLPGEERKTFLDYFGEKASRPVICRNVPACGSIPSCTNSSATRCCAAMAGDANRAAQCQISKYTTENFVANPGMMRERI